MDLAIQEIIFDSSAGATEASNHNAQYELIAILATQLDELSAVRRVRVEALRKNIESGAYHPTARAIADAMLGEESYRHGLRLELRKRLSKQVY